MNSRDELQGMPFGIAIEVDQINLLLRAYHPVIWLTMWKLQKRSNPNISTLFNRLLERIK